MFSLRTHLIICLALFATLFGSAVLGNMLAASGVIHPLRGTAQVIALSVFLLLFLAAGLSAIPVMIKLVLGAQERLGNQDAPVIGAMIARQTPIVWAIWILILAGTLVALPAMIADGFFGPGPKLWGERTTGRMAAGPNLGRLAARPDMLVADMTRQSTMAVDARHPEAAIAGGGVFDFAIPGATLVFHGARYYYITTYEDDHSRVQAVNVGISPAKMSRADLDAANADLRARLIGDGWLAGHEVYRDGLNRTLHGGAARGPEGGSWLKDGIVLDLEAKRMDEEKPGEDPGAAGEWIQFIGLWARKDYPGIDCLVFQTSTARVSAAR